MEIKNQTSMMNFILLGLSDYPAQQTALFVLFFTMYLIAILSNSTIMVTIAADPQLHTPMYFFILNLSLVDICMTTVIVPQLLVNIISQSRTISFPGCFTQLFFFVVIGNANFLLLGAMAYDRYIAICKPLHYFMVMNRTFCVQVVASSWVIGLLHSLLHSMMTTRLSFCASNLIQSFFCDLPPLLKLSCSDTTINEILLFTEALSIVLISFASIVISYTYIISTVLSIHTREGRNKAFSTCSSHLIVIILYYGTIFFIYLRPSSRYSLEKDKAVTVMYTIVTPMLNPFIYSLRNQKMKDALKKIIGRALFFRQL
ncbi:olfactory receptor 1L6-like [Pleurodeles waltl]|uniref:olfactory receptor 1L6-like n=1 Tax=Pleurodeles waltl TaxID=8319 RepID=UPI0037097A15